MILFLDCPRVPGRNHACITSPAQCRTSPDTIERFASPARGGQRVEGVLWAERTVKQESLRDGQELLVLAGVGPLSSSHRVELQQILESLLGSVSSSELPSCRSTSSSLMVADFMGDLESHLYREVAARGIQLNEVMLPRKSRRLSLFMKIALTVAVFTIAVSFFSQLKSGKKDGIQQPMPEQSPWAFLAAKEWRVFSTHVGLTLSEDEAALLQPPASKSSGKKDVPVSTKALDEKLAKWGKLLKEELALNSDQPQAIAVSETLGVLKNAGAPGDQMLPAGWITNFKDQRSHYGNDLRSAAVELEDFLRAIEREDNLNELRPIIDRTCSALLEYKGAGAFSDLIRSRAQELQPCPKGWSVPTLRDVQRLSAIKQLLSSPAFVKLAYDDDEVSRPESSRKEIPWKEIHKLCQKGHKLHEAASAEQKLFESLLK